MNDNVILTLSGGLDSSTVLALLHQENKKINVLTVNYGQKNWEKELENVRSLCDLYDVNQLRIIDLTWLGELGGSAITDKNIELTSDEDSNLYVPFRNTLILSVCVAWAEVIGCNLIYTGSIDGNEEDICPDNTLMYYEKLNELIYEATKKDIKVVAPLINLNKSQVLKLAVDLGLPLDYTWSCVSSDKYPCEKCFPCVDRKEAFESLCLEDPIYEASKVKKYGKIK